MPAAQRNGDSNSAGGKINSVPQSSVKCNGELLSVNGSKGTGHGIGIHAAGAWSTANGFSSVKAEGIAVNHTGIKTANGFNQVLVGGTPVNHVGNADTCSTHTRSTGSGNVNINTSG